MAGAPVKYKIEDLINALNNFIDRARAGEVKSRQVTFRAEYGISKERLWQLSKDNPKLLHSLEILNSLEEDRLVNGGEDGTIPAPFAKFRLMQKPFNYSDKQEIESKSININQDITALTPEERAKRIKELEDKLSGRDNA